ncbi:MAG: CBS domain-containing protein [Nitrospirae bacterium]|uniref:CBS domain-containing protein n=1 Tax=Candidatus Magnetobacterium casense TaxID=1455061 RepID=UPI00058C6BD9|nr:CBS domain-containing protein [Candidatus Magnetobacterium casensis]MBF0336335.1 CBS domain-containing protein [Nitrospirota bacterium]
MIGDKKVQDMMVDIFEMPHIPYWFTIKQALRLLRKSYPDVKIYPYSMMVLVFDEKYHLLGSVSIQEILRGLEPELLSPAMLAGAFKDDGQLASTHWEVLFDVKGKEVLQHPVSEIMTPISTFVNHDDPVTKAAYMMFCHNTPILPVLEGKKKLLGIIRMADIFHGIAAAI